jgi:hypothetical protein
MMNVSEMDDIRTHDVSLEAVIAPDDEPLSHDDCEQCGAPVDRLQRYCVSCGAHRHHVPDPAARYLAQASARARVGASARRPAARRRSSVSPLTAVLVAAVLAGGGVAVGAAIDGGSTNNNAQVIRALHRLEAGQSAVGAGLGSHRAAGADSHSGKTKQSASAVKRLQHATGSSYVKQARQLSNSVSIP